MIIKLQNYFLKVSVDSIGCTLLKLEFKNQGTWTNTIISLKDKDYAVQDWYCGAIVGRFSNRIKDGKFELDGKAYHIPTADEGNALHGNHGLDRVNWQYQEQDTTAYTAVFHYTSPDGEHGFPARVDFVVTITLDSQSLLISYQATADQNTPLSLTHHPYFNLNKVHSDNISNHEFQFNTNSFLELKDMIPTGKILATNDFNQYASLHGRDYDDCYLSKDHPVDKILQQASIINRDSNISLEVFSDLPSFQFYTGKWIPEMHDSDGNTIGSNSGFCIEPEYYPDSPNQSAFPNCIFGPDRIYNHNIQYKFSTI